MVRACGKLAWVVVGLVLAGCSAEPALIQLSVTAPPGPLDNCDLAAVLAAYVTDDGRVNLDGMTGQPPVRATLEAQLAKMASGGPTATPQHYPTGEARWAYWYNARAAWSLRLLGERQAPSATVVPPMRTARDKVRFPLDGRVMSLADIDAILLSEARRTGNFRLAACAPGASYADAALPRRPHEAEAFVAALPEALDRLILDGRRFVVDIENRRVRVPATLWAVRDLVIAQYRRDYHVEAIPVDLLTALRPQVSPAARRRLDEALGYELSPRSPEPAIPKARVFVPGRIGRVEP